MPTHSKNLHVEDRITQGNFTFPTMYLPPIPRPGLTPTPTGDNDGEEVPMSTQTQLAFETQQASLLISTSRGDLVAQFYWNQFYRDRPPLRRVVNPIAEA